MESFDTISDAVQRYISNPSKQINLGYTVVTFISTGAFFLGLALIILSLLMITFIPDYRDGNKSKRPLLILAWIGIALCIFGLWTTISSFYRVVYRINKNIKERGDCSLFVRDGADQAIDILTAESIKEDAINMKINEEADKFRGASFRAKSISANDSLTADATSGSIQFSGGPISAETVAVQGENTIKDRQDKFKRIAESLAKEGEALKQMGIVVPKVDVPGAVAPAPAPFRFGAS